ncbi:MAG TPA: CZB domain-containing protein [Roseiarcus sp.]|nr:CZB domain-containing protein [Roseiarcus sp.]
MQRQLDDAAISKEDRRPLGGWLHGEAKQKYGQLRSYSQSVGAHAAFHREAARIAALANKKTYEAAGTALGGGLYSAAKPAAGRPHRKPCSMRPGRPPRLVELGLYDRGADKRHWSP